MPSISNVTLAPIAGSSGNSKKSVITVTYTVSFDVNDQGLDVPYRARAYVLGDDREIIGDIPGRTDDRVWNLGLRAIHPRPAVQTITDTFEVPGAALNEGSCLAPASWTTDEVRVRIGLKPSFVGYPVMSPESNLQTVSLV